MAKVLGVGGVFFKSPDPARLTGWYAEWLGLPLMTEAGAAFAAFAPAAMPAGAYTVWSPFVAGTTYFAPSAKDFMFNLVVDNLDEALRQVQAGGAQLAGEVEDSAQGRFGWFVDPDGNKVELWQPPQPTGKVPDGGD
jgi:predicted enzyme related to lactoylglutathione lyase